MIVNPGAWSHYSYAIHDALELFSGPLVEVHLSNPEERAEEWRHALGDRRRSRRSGSSATGRTATAKRSSSSAGARERPRRPAAASASRSRSSSRTRRTSATSAASRARTQRCSSSPNASASSPTSATPRAARAIDGVEFVEAKRDLYQTLSELLSGTIGFEATSLTFERYARLHAGGIDPVAALRARRGAARGQGRGRARLDPPRRRRSSNIAFERFADEGDFVGHTERELAWRFEQFLHEANADGVSFPVHVASGPNAAKPHTDPGERRVEAGETRDRRRGLRRRRLLLRLHADVRDRLASRTSCSARTRSASTPSSPGSRRFGPARPGPASTRPRATGSRRPASARRSATASDTASASSCTRIRASRRSPEHARGRQRGHGRARHLPAPVRAGSGSRISSSSRTTGPRC